MSVTLSFYSFITAFTSVLDYDYSVIYSFYSFITGFYFSITLSLVGYLLILLIGSCLYYIIVCIYYYSVTYSFYSFITDSIHVSLILDLLICHSPCLYSFNAIPVYSFVALYSFTPLHSFSTIFSFKTSSELHAK